MKHPTYFPTFMKNEVNIDATRLDKLDGHVNSVFSALQGDDVIGHLVKEKIKQGSWPHRTIIRPKPGGEFDADFLLRMDVNDDWDGNPTAYIDAVYYALGRHNTYKDMPHGRRTRCVYLEYSPINDIGCHLDIVPYLYLPDGRKVIVNRTTNTWESTAPEAFTAWIKRRDEITNGNFRKVVRLMKYYKVHRGSFNGVPSIILTTLLGEQVSEVKPVIDPDCYKNIPSTLLTIVADLDTYLQNRPTMPTVVNPGGDGTTFDHRWEQPTYTNFRDRMHTCAQKMAEANEEVDAEKSMKLWQDIFGDKFKPVATPTTNSKYEAGAATAAAASRSGKSG
jgi:hypothetical protein